MHEFKFSTDQRYTMRFEAPEEHQMTDVLERLHNGIPDGEGIGYAIILMDKAADEIERLRAALDKIIGVALGRADFPAAMVHRIAHDALGPAEQKAREGK